MEREGRARRSPVRWIAVAALALPLVAPPSVAGGEVLVVEELRGMRAEVASLIVQGIPGGRLPMAAMALPELAERLTTESGETRYRVPLVFEVPAAALASGESGGAARTIELYVYALDADSGVVDHVARRLELGSGATQEVELGSGVKLAASVTLPAGTHSLRFLAVEPEAPRYGLAVERLEVGGPIRPLLGPPRIAEPCAGWIETTAGPQPDELPRYSARPVLTSGDRVPVSLVATGSAGGGSGERLVARFAPRDGGEAVATVLNDNGEPTDRALVVPELAQGVYRLTVAGGGYPASSEPIEVWVVGRESLQLLGDGADTGCRLSWSHILAVAAGDDRAVVAVAPRQPEIDVDPETDRQFRAAYRDVLRKLALDEDLEAAAGALATVEASFIGVGADGWRVARQAELAVARALAKGDEECLVPLLLLHELAYELHYTHRRFPLATHSREMVVALGELLMQRSPEPTTRRLVAGSLASLAEHLERRHLRVLSQELLRRAVELDPEQENALLLLAANRETLGYYTAARTRLEQLAAVNSKNMEARLRLARMLARTGDERAARAALRRIVREGAKPWILSLAYQDLARLAVARGDFDAAVRVLEEGVRRLPGDQHLHLRLVYSLERAGRLAEARARTAGVPLSGGRSPRWRYTEPPRDDLAAAERRRRLSVVVRLPLLGRALESETAAP